jgi:signal transduction histidine kinase
MFANLVDNAIKYGPEKGHINSRAGGNPNFQFFFTGYPPARVLQAVSVSLS